MKTVHSPRALAARRVRWARLWIVMATALFAVGGAAAQDFLQPVLVPGTDGWASAIYTADFNGDGNPDLLLLGHGATPTSSTTYLLFGNGRGSFTPAPFLSSAGTSIGIGDFLGTGGTQFMWAVGLDHSPTGVCPSAVIQTVIAEINVSSGVLIGRVGGEVCARGANLPVVANLTGAKLHDGQASDVVFADTANNLLYVVTPGAAAGQASDLLSAQSYPLPDGAGPIAVTDLNSDGHLDLVVNGQAGRTADVFLGNGAGGLTSLQSFSGLSGVHSLLLQDVTLDGRPDLIAEGANGHIDVFPGNGDGTFQSTSVGGSGAVDGTTGNGGHLIALADLNHDGKVDALTSTPAGISALLGNGSSYLGLGGIYNAGPAMTTFAVADFNGDGNLDVAVDSPYGVIILYGNPDGSFLTNQSFAAGQPALSSATGVFTGSGNTDAVVATGSAQAQLLRGNGDGTFAYLGSPGTPTPTSAQNGIAGAWSNIAAGDFNGDGKLDILLTADGPNALLPALSSGQASTGLLLQEGNGSGSFTSASPFGYTPYSTPNPPSCTPPFSHYANAYFGVSAVADFDRNGTMDIANRDSTGFRLLLSGKNNGVPTSSTSDRGVGNVAPDCSPDAHQITIAGDFAGNGVPDVFFQDAGHLLLYLNDGYGDLTPNQLAPIAEGDLAVDGSLTTPGQATAPVLNNTFNGPAIPVSAGGLGFPAAISSAAAADLDRDGNLDLIVVYANLAANRQVPSASTPNAIYIWYGSGGGHFLATTKHPVNPVRITPQLNDYQVVVADVNGDGIPDLLLTDGYLVSLLPGTGDGTFGQEQRFLVGQGINSISVADVNHDGKLDLVIANGGAALSNPAANLDALGTNPDVNTGGITVLLNRGNVLQAAMGAVTAIPEPSSYGQAFTLTATLAASSGAVAPTGTVSFAVDGTTIGSAAVSAGSATVPVPSTIYATLPVGTHSLTASYSGDSNFAPANFAGTHTVTALATTLNLLLCVDPPGSNFPCGNPINTTPLISPISMFYGQSTDGVAIESAIDLTGTITFYDGKTVFCVLNANLQQGSNSCPATSGIFPVGTATVTAVYSGDSVHSPSTSNGIVVTVNQDTTATTLTSSLNPATVGQAVTFTAVVAGNYAIPNGSVVFTDNGALLATVPLDATGTATYTTSTLAIGTHPIAAVYLGAPNFQAAAAATLSQVIAAPLTAVQSTITLTSNINPSALQQAVTLTATVSAGSATPSGTVNFYDGTTLLGTASLSGTPAVATLTTATLTAGSHALTATFSGTPGSSGFGTLPTPLPPKPVTPKPAATAGFSVSAPGVSLPRPYVAAAPVAAAVPAPVARPSAAVAIAPITASTSLVYTQVVTAPAIVAQGPAGFTLTVTPATMSVETGRTATLQVTVKTTGAFFQPVLLSCTGLPSETNCIFGRTILPIGGGTTTLLVTPAAPHDCGGTTYYGMNGGAGGGLVWAVTFPGLALLLCGRRKRLAKIVVLLVSLGALGAISGCGHCTDLGVLPGTYSFSVSAVAQGGPVSETAAQPVQMTVTIP